MDISIYIPIIQSISIESNQDVYSVFFLICCLVVLIWFPLDWITYIRSFLFVFCSWVFFYFSLQTQVRIYLKFGFIMPFYFNITIDIAIGKSCLGSNKQAFHDRVHLDLYSSSKSVCNIKLFFLFLSAGVPRQHQVGRYVPAAQGIYRPFGHVTAWMQLPPGLPY
jgi:hypothetical protein